MQNVGIERASERAVFVALISVGISLAAAALTTTGIGIALYLTLGLLIIGGTILRVYSGVLDYLHRVGGRALGGFFAIFFPLAGTIIYSLYPIAVNYVATAGIVLGTRFVVLSIISGLLALLNLTILIVNLFAVFRTSEPVR